MKINGEYEMNIYENKKYITSVNEKYVFFKLPNGDKYKTHLEKKALIDVLEWLHTEMDFYNRMYNETKELYDSEKERFTKTAHYYSEEEIMLAACYNNRFSVIDMKMSNEKYIRTWDRISGKFEIVHKASAKYWTLYKIASQIENVIKTM